MKKEPGLMPGSFVFGHGASTACTKPSELTASQVTFRLAGSIRSQDFNAHPGMLVVMFFSHPPRRADSTVTALGANVEDGCHG
jgi:hypothetical protein